MLFLNRRHDQHEMGENMSESPGNLEIRKEARNGRFSAALSPDGCPRPLYDEVLCETRECVVTPTLGAIVPFWFLVIPRISSANFVEWRGKTGVDPALVVGDILRAQKIDPDRAIWFEHGPRQQGSQLGCGVDHAHLHVVVDAPFLFEDFVAEAMAASGVNWRDQSTERAYRSIGDGTSYLAAMSMEQAVIAEQVEHVGSQFFRRVIARLVGRPNSWDYKVHPHLENVESTIAAFNSRAKQLAVA